MNTNINNESLQQYDSAQTAFESLDIGNKLSRRLVTRKCKEVAKALGIDVSARKIGTSASDVLFQLFNDNNFLRHLFNKTIRAGQLNHSESIIIFSDVYHTNPNHLRAVIEQCSNAGVHVTSFEKRFPCIYEKGGFTPPTNVKYMYTGYSYIYRGILSGIIIW
jgi:hypothetical protein